MKEPYRRTELLRRISLLSFEEKTRELLCIPLRISGVRVDFLTHSEPLFRRVRDYFTAYLGGGPAVGEVLAEVLPSPDLWEDIDPEFDLRGDRVVQRDFAARRIKSAGGPERAVALVAPELDDAFHNLLRWFVPPILLREGAFLMHGAGALRDGKGYVFFGHSDAGKSTSVSLIAEADSHATVLGDDGIIIQMRGNQPYVLAAPLGCGYSSFAPPPLSAPLHGLYVLQQDRVHRIEGFSPTEGITQLLASVMNIGFDEDVEEKIQLATRFALSSCKIQKLRFKKDPGFWPLVRLGKKEEFSNVQN